jgi:NNP family nitrate/nitrite transporter-like MFS transporter
MAAGVYLPSGIATLTSLISPQHWGKGIAIHELAPNLGFIAAPIVSEALLGWISWRGILVLIGVSSMLLGTAFACFGRSGDFAGESLNIEIFRSFIETRSFWIMIILLSLGVSGFLGLYSMLPLYLVTEHGMERNWANILLSLSRVSGLGMVFFGGWATDRLGPKRIIGIILVLTGMMTCLLGAVSYPFVVIMVFLQAIPAVCFPPAALVALSLIGPPKTRNLSISLTIPFGFLIGSGAIPAAIGIMGDLGLFGPGIALLGVLMLPGSILPRYLKFFDRE